MRKVYVNVITRLVLEVEDGISIEDVLNEMDYDYVSVIDGADIVDVELTDYDIVDSK